MPSRPTAADLPTRYQNQIAAQIYKPGDHVLFQSKEMVCIGTGTAKRVRQSAKPLLNKLESEYQDVLLTAYDSTEILAQSVRLKLGNGVWYKPDFWLPSDQRFIEVKGPHAFRGGLENLKVAASVHRWATFRLVWKQNGEWQEQEILP